MPYSFDYFVGKLRCRSCSEISPADETTNMQTKICLKPQLAPYGVGSRLEIDVEHIVESGYLLIHKPSDPLTFRLIDTWDCPNCGIPFNWALISISKGVIDDIKDICLDESSDISAHYIIEDCEFLGWQVLDGRLIKSISES